MVKCDWTVQHWETVGQVHPREFLKSFFPVGKIGKLTYRRRKTKQEPKENRVETIAGMGIGIKSRRGLRVCVVDTRGRRVEWMDALVA